LYDYSHNAPDAAARREIIRQTVRNAVAVGGSRTFFLDGETFSSPADRADCAVNGCPPSDPGFYRMAEAICPVLRNALQRLNTGVSV
jgi:hypothetical protein